MTAQPTHSAAPKASKPAFPKNEAVIKLTAVSDCWVGLTNGATGQQLYQGVIAAGTDDDLDREEAGLHGIGNPPGIHLTVNGKSQQTNSVNPITLNINPLNNAQVTVG